MQIFSGSSNQELAAKIAKIARQKLGQVMIECFANGETKLRVTEPKVEGRVAIVQSMSAPTNEMLVEFCLLADALRRAGAREIVVVVPWMGYSKQDKVFRIGEPLSAKVAAQILQTAKPDRIITFDLHNRATLGFFDVPVVELSAKPLFVEYFAKKKTTKTVVVAPDEGAVKASAEFARELGVPIVYLDKRRDLASGQVTVARASGEVAGAEAIITDDMIVTGETAMKVAQYLKAHGAIRVAVGATHDLQVPGVRERLKQSEIDEIVVTDTVEEQDARREKIDARGKLKVLSVAQMIAGELTR